MTRDGQSTRERPAPGAGGHCYAQGPATGGAKQEEAPPAAATESAPMAVDAREPAYLVQGAQVEIASMLQAPDLLSPEEYTSTEKELDDRLSGRPHFRIGTPPPQEETASAPPMPEEGPRHRVQYTEVVPAGTQLIECDTDEADHPEPEEQAAKQ